MVNNNESLLAGQWCLVCNKNNQAQKTRHKIKKTSKAADYRSDPQAVQVTEQSKIRVKITMLNMFKEIKDKVENVSHELEHCKNKWKFMS